MAEHRRKNDDAPESSIHSRSGDYDPMKRLVRTLIEYKMFWLIGMAICTWIGGRVVRPLNQVDFNAAAIAELKLRQDANDSTDREWQQIVKIVVRVQCKTLSEEDKYKYDLCHPAMEGRSAGAP